MKEYYPEQYPDIPSERSFRRRISEIPACVIDYARRGKKSCFDHFVEYIERPESLKRIIKNGQLPRDFAVRDILKDWIDGDFNCQDYGGTENKYKNMSRIGGWNESINCDDVVFRDASDEDLTLLLARPARYQKIKRNGVYIRRGY